MIDNPVGIDKPIQELQQLFIDELWTDVASDKKQFNHRVFRNLKNDNLIPEIYTDKNEYEEVLFDDYLSALCWFDVAPNSDEYIFGQNERQLGILFIINLDELYPTLTHRAVEESHIEVTKKIQKNLSFLTPYEIIEGVEAYGDFSIDNLKHPDMQPWHVFRVNCTVLYNIKC